jgi:beta-lactam-binding protein with PASTA domain
VPDLFGVPTQQALTVLATLNLDVDVILDVMGHEVAKTTVPPQYQNQPVLEQQPPAGTVVDPASQRLRLVIATALEEAPVVTMPSLIGLTIDEAAQVLDRLGLKVGTTTIRATS